MNAKEATQLRRRAAEARLAELRLCRKETLLEMFGRSHRVHGATRSTPKMDLIYAIIEDEFGRKIWD